MEWGCLHSSYTFKSSTIQIYIYGNETRFNRELKLNSSSQAVYIHDFAASMTYHVQIAAFNQAGDGLKTDVIAVGKNGSLPELLVCLLVKRLFLKV